MVLFTFSDPLGSSCCKHIVHVTVSADIRPVLGTLQVEMEVSGNQGAPICLAVKELKLSYHSSETISFTLYPYYGNLN